MLHSYMRASEYWTEPSRISRRRRYVTCSLIGLIALWSLFDRGRTWYEEAFWWSSHPQNDSYMLPWLSLGYYAVSALVDMACCYVLQQMRSYCESQAHTLDDRFSEPDDRSLEGSGLSFLSEPGAPFSEGSKVLVLTEKIPPVLRKNVWVMRVTVMMAFLQVLRLRPETFKGLYRSYEVLMYVCYTARYALFYDLAKPATRTQEDPSRPSLEQDIDDALHCAPDFYYKKYEFRRGNAKAMVVSNSQYQESSGFAAQTLPDGMDGNIRFGNSLELLGFLPNCHRNLTGSDIRQRFESFVSDAGKDDVDGFAFVYLGHGTQDCIVGVDGEEVRVAELIEMIQLEFRLQARPIPKLLIFDCCRGSGVEFTMRRQVCVQGVSVRNAFPPRMGSLHTRPSIHSDFLLCHATADGYVAFNGNLGGLFSQTLVEKIENFFAPDRPAGRNVLDFIGLITEVNRVVSTSRIGRAGGKLYKQAPEIRSSLTRKFEISAPRQRRCSDPEPYARSTPMDASTGACA